MPNKSNTLKIQVSGSGSGAQRNQNKKKKRKAAPGAPGKKKRNATVAKRRGVGGLAGYQRMIADPCNSPLIPGLYGTMEGYLSRFHSIVSPAAVDGKNMASGVVLWCPKFHNPGRFGSDINTVGGTTGSIYNLLISTTETSSTGINFTGVGVGSAEVLTAGATYNPARSQSFEDPAWGFVGGPTCGDARTLSACMRMSYYGTMSDTAGMIAHIDVPLSYLMDGLVDGGTSSYHTVDRFFASSQKVMRTSLDAIDQKWIPSEDGIFLTAPSKANVKDLDSDDLIFYAKGATPPTTGEFSEGSYARTYNPRVIGFAWRGFNPGAGIAAPIQFDLYKNIEWKPQYGTGITVPRSVRTSITPPVQAAVMALDAGGKSWTQEVVHEVGSVASKVAKSALAFSGELVTHALGFN